MIMIWWEPITVRDLVPAARYIGTTFAELERDCHVYDTKAVTIVEVMGRNADGLQQHLLCQEITEVPVLI